MNKNRETEPHTANRNRGPIRSEGIGTRISAVADLIGTRKNASSAAGITTDQLARYIREENHPRLAPMAALCSAGGVNLEWLATGEGPQMIGEASSDKERSQFGESTPAQADTVVDAEVLEDVLTVLRARQHRTGRRWLPRNEARLAAEIYQYLIEQEQPTPEDRARVLKLVDRIIEGSNVEPHAQGDD